MSGTRRKSGGNGIDGMDFRLGDLFGDLGSALTEMIERLDAGSDGEIRRVHEFESRKGPVSAQAGIRIRVGGFAGDRGHRDPATPRHPENSANEPARGDSPSTRPVAADIEDDGTTWRLTADLAGAGRENLDLSIEDDELVIVAQARSRRYADRIAVPPGTALADLSVTLQNGILEIEAPSAKRSTP